MQAFRSAPRVASQFRSVGLPRLVRGYATKSYEHVLVSTPKEGVGLGKSECLWIRVIAGQLPTMLANRIQFSSTDRRRSMPSAPL